MTDFVYSKDDKELLAYYEVLRKEHEDECKATGKPQACHELAEFYDIVDKQPEKAAPLFRSLCHSGKGFGRSCTYLGNMLLYGRGCKRDVKAALAEFETACALNNVEGCHNAGMIHRLGKKDEVPVNNAKAIERFEFGCKQDFRNSCFYLGVMYLQGRNGMEKDMAKALRYSEKACELNHPWGCANAARMYDLGDGVAMDKAKAEKLKEKARSLSQSQ